MSATGPGRKVYLAARYSRVAEMHGVRGTLQAMGHTVTSRWIDDPGVYDEARLESDPEGSAAFAAEALADICAADTLISFTGGGGKGGRHVEFGYAFRMGLRLVVAGPREHVFHALPQVEWYPGFAHLVAAWAPEFVRDDFVQDRRADLDPNRAEAGYDDFSGDWKADR
jgi:hypothetical protein